MSTIATRPPKRTAHDRHDACGCEHRPAPTPPMPWKQLLDRTLAALLLVPGLPLIGLLVLLVRLTSRGQGVYSQRRVGKGGLLFTMYKLRSMRIDAEAA